MTEKNPYAKLPPHSHTHPMSGEKIWDENAAWACFDAGRDSCKVTPLTEPQITALVEALPDGAIGYAMTWGYLNLARAIEKEIGALPSDEWIVRVTVLLDHLTAHHCPGSVDELRRLVEARVQPAASAVQDKGAMTLVAHSDRAMLEAVMNDLDVSWWYCPKCGHGEECKDMDAARMLRDHLAATPAAQGDAHADCPPPVNDTERAEREHMGCAHCRTGIYAQGDERAILAEWVRLTDARERIKHKPNPQRSDEWEAYRREIPKLVERARVALDRQLAAPAAKGTGCGLRAVAEEALAVIERLRPPNYGMGTIIRLRAALAVAKPKGSVE